MTLNKREKVLAGVVGGLAALFVLYFMLQPILSMFLELQSSIDAKFEEVDKLKGQLAVSEKAREKLGVMRHRSLPADPQVGRTLYQDWLLELVHDRLQLHGTKVEPTEMHEHKWNTAAKTRPGGGAGRAAAKDSANDLYYVVPFVIRGQGTLDELTRFLFEFYNAGYLHQIRHIGIKPTGNSKDLELTITVEAVSLPDAELKDKLRPPEGNLLAATLPDYQKAIVDRNIFAPYAPHVVKPDPPHPVARPTIVDKFDKSKYTYLTAIVAVDDTLGAWFFVRPTGTTLVLHEGEPIEVGTVKGTISRIDQGEVEIQDAGGNRRVLHIGVPLNASEADKAAASGPSVETVKPDSEPPAEARKPGFRRPGDSKKPDAGRLAEAMKADGGPPAEAKGPLANWARRRSLKKTGDGSATETKNADN
jgi:hypothetical protein